MRLTRCMVCLTVWDTQFHKECPSCRRERSIPKAEFDLVFLKDEDKESDRSDDVDFRAREC